MADSQKDPTAQKSQYWVTANQVAHPLLVNSRGEMPTKQKYPKLSLISEADSPSLKKSTRTA